MKKIILCLILLVISLFSISIQANNIHIYINGEEETEFLEAIIEEDNVLVKAQSLAELFNAEFRWRKSIQTLSLSRDNTNIKMMVDNPYIQVNKRTSRCPVGMKMIDGSNYIPLKEIAENFDFLYEKNGDDIYISNPQTLIENVTWGEDGQQIKIEMDKISPYRINPTDDPNRLEVELDKAALSEDFTDNLSNSNYYLRVNRVANKARIKFTIISNKPIPFINDNNIEENGDDLLLNFLPSINEIRWENQELEILSNGEISRPEIMLLQEPRRLVLDIPNLMLQNYELDIKENEWIKDVRVSQFKLDPVVLRVVLDLHEDKYLHLDEDIKDEDRVVLETSSDNTMLDNLNFADNKLEFTSDNPIVPDIFHLEDPERLVVNIMNADRGDSFDSNIDLDGNIVSQIRTSRFNEETIRLVVDLNEMTGYRLKEESLSDGRIKHIISFENNFEDILLSDSNSRTNINLKFNGSVKYETKKLSSPDRFVIDVEGANLREDYEPPEEVGVIKDIRVSQFSNDPQIIRFVFETGKYEDYNLFSMDTNTSINISFLKETTEKNTDELIVLDPGHGGFDPGAIGSSGLQEKDVVLEIASLTERLLKNAGYEALISRDGDEFLSLKERVELANNLNAMVYISIHANSSNSRYSEGIETFIAESKVADSLPLANRLQDEMLTELKRLDRGVKKENFYVIKHTKMPSALVEVGFLSNPHEESLLASNLFKEKAARAISRGIIEFIENN